MSKAVTYTVPKEDIISFPLDPLELFQKNDSVQVCFRVDKKLGFNNTLLLNFEDTESFIFKIIDFTPMPSMDKSKQLVRCQISQTITTT